jgi:hypothetical protein
MPWILLALALVLGVYAATAQQTLEVTQRVTTQKAATPGTDTAKTESTPSDTVVGALFGLAAITALAGAFYGRISKISLPGGGGLELGAAALDLDSIADAVADAVKEEFKPEAGETIDLDKVADFATRATARANQKALLLRLGVGAPPAVPTDVSALLPAHRGMPLPDDLVKRLAASAVEETRGQDGS